MRLFVALILALCLAVPAEGAKKANPPKPEQAVAITDVGPFLQTISVNVKAPARGRRRHGTQGSGTVINVTRKGKPPVTFIITAHHVIETLRQVKDVIIDGTEMKSVTYRDGQVVHEQSNEAGTRVVGENKLDAKIINVDVNRDIGLMQVRAVGKFPNTVKFYLGDRVPTVATQVLHCGCPGGQNISGTGAVFDGIISRVVARIPDFGGSEHGVYDHVSTPALGGSSGGMIARSSDGLWLGMITLGLKGGDSHHWMVPVRSVRAWAEEIDAEWLLEPGAIVTQEQIDAIPLENSSVAGSGKSEEVESDFETLELYEPGENPFVRRLL